jgi:hypothetical protein|tara:strand:+ start:168 stop:392 length:225 start_codon:yes stop_codon:yes gene_type:complete
MKTIKEKMLEANQARTDLLSNNPEINSNWTPDAIGKMKKLWRKKVEIPLLQKQVDKILRKINVKLKRSKNVREN